MAKGFTTGFGPARCFLLKDARGHVGGMLRQSGGRLSCKAQADGSGEGRLALCFVDGAERTLPLQLDGAERDWPDEGRAVERAYVTADGRLLLATDARAREAYARECEREERRARRPSGAQGAARAAEKMEETEKTETAEEPEKTGNAPANAQARETARAAGESARAEASAGDGAPAAAQDAPDGLDAPDAPAGQSAPLPEGRWPPPPCMPGARYRDGRWIEVSPSAR